MMFDHCNETKDILDSCKEHQHSIFVKDLNVLWKSAVRTYNYAENHMHPDTAQDMASLVVRISQIKEFHETLAAPSQKESE